MAQKPETKFKQIVIKRLRKLPKCWFFKVQAGSIVGIPDIIGCVNGRFFAWELKVGKNKATKKQQLVLALISKAGGHTAIVRPENLTEELDALIKRFI